MTRRFYDFTAPPQREERPSATQRLEAIEETLEDVYSMVLGLSMRPAHPQRKDGGFQHGR